MVLQNEVSLGRWMSFSMFMTSICEVVEGGMKRTAKDAIVITHINITLFFRRQTIAQY